MAGGSTPGTSLVARTLAVLATFDETHPELTLAEIAERATLPRPTALRIVRELVSGEALTRSGRLYRVGRRMWGLGLLAPVETGLREVASPYLQDLHVATRATVHLAIREDDQVLYVDRLAGHLSVPIVSRTGSRLPLHPTGVGKVLLAHAPADLVERVMADLQPLTPFTITAPGILARELAKVRTDGYATTREEMSLGACSVAVPVRRGPAPDAEVVAAIGVVVADHRRDLGRLVAGLTVAARGISRGLAGA